MRRGDLPRLQLVGFFDLSNVVMLFPVTTAFIALRLGRLAGAWASPAVGRLLDFFFVEPKFSSAVTDTQYILTFALMMVVAVA